MRNKRTAGADSAIRIRRGRRLVAIIAVLGVLVTASIIANPTLDSAQAATKYPSWADVLAARKNAAHAAALVKQIQALLVQLDAQVASTSADAAAKGDAYQKAEEAYFEAATKAAALQSQASAADKTARESERKAGLMAASLARTGSNSVPVQLFFDGAHAGDLLGAIGQGGKVTEQIKATSDRAVQDRNTAQSLTDQAKVAETILKKLKAEAETAFNAAQAAAAAAQTAQDAAQAHEEQLKGLLASLTTKKNQTEKQYLAGVKAQYGAGAGLGAGQVSASGWAKPAIGYISSGFGYRVNPIDGGYRLHSGTDLAAGCGIPIYAAHSGTVVYAGPYGSYGNFILLDDGDGIQTGYAHIMNGGILVHLGQHVGVGQNIARTGRTGEATGCHLHFEVRPGGVAVNAVPFMRKQGIILG